MILKYIKNIFNKGELQCDSVVANFATVQVEKEIEVKRNITYYNFNVYLDNMCLR